jgi:hypothetical protein
MLNPTRTLLAALVMTAGMSGLAAAQPYPGIPALREERIPPPPPGARMVWEPGHWHWNGRNYAWIGGHYIRPMHGRSQFVRGHWVNERGRWVWVGGHWR